jgi:hypothetical protein
VPRRQTKNFSDLLDPKFRWPAPDDKLFVSTDANSDADLSPRFEAREFLIREGYKNAADMLVEKSRESNLDRDSLVYPIVFCYRHYLELALKALIAAYGPVVSIAPNWKSHNMFSCAEEIHDAGVLFRKRRSNCFQP